MKSIFDKKTNSELLERLEKLTPQSQPSWGKMNVSQMLWHCQQPHNVATAALPLKKGLLGFLFGKMAKNDFLKKMGFSKNLPTHPKFKIETTPDFETERKILINQVKTFGEKGPNAIDNKKHPFFGLMNDTEWGNLLGIHLDHHLTQFNV
ncbi:MAG: DUF1569 domain-containing protein [Flavobacterium sp.]|nr:DUF1569 domain-containing protein [Flavobacterium sp.]